MAAALKDNTSLTTLDLNCTPAPPPRRRRGAGVVCRGGPWRCHGGGLGGFASACGRGGGLSEEGAEVAGSQKMKSGRRRMR